MNRIKFWNEAEKEWETLFQRARKAGRRKKAHRYKKLSFKARLQAQLEKKKMEQNDPNEMLRVGTHGRWIKKSSLA